MHLPYKKRFKKIKHVMKNFLFGATVFNMAQDALRMKTYHEHALMLVSIGDMLGYPLHSYYRLKLIPYWLTKLDKWKILLLKERDVTDKIF